MFSIDHVKNQTVNNSVHENQAIISPKKGKFYVNSIILLILKNKRSMICDSLAFRYRTYFGFPLVFHCVRSLFVILKLYFCRLTSILKQT